MKVSKRQLVEIIKSSLTEQKMSDDDRVKYRKKMFFGENPKFDSKLEILQTMWMMFNPEGAGSRLAAIKSPESVIVPDANLLFDGDFLHWRSGEKTVIKFPAIAGITPWNEESWVRYYKEVGDFSKMKGEGPPPEGKYSVGRLQTAPGVEDNSVADLEAGLQFYKIFHGDLYDKLNAGEISQEEYDEKAQKYSGGDTNFYSPKSRSRLAWGNYRASFTKLPGTKTFGRGSFYIHGGEQIGSHGCIDLLTHMDDFSKLLAFWRSQPENRRRQLVLTVKYKPQFSELLNKWLDAWDDGEANQSQDAKTVFDKQLAFLQDENISLSDKAARVAELAISAGRSFPVEDVADYLRRQGMSVPNITKFMKSVYDYFTGADLERD